MTFSIVKEGKERNILNLHLARKLTKNEEGKYAFHCRRFAFGRQHFAAKYRLKEEKKVFLSGKVNRKNTLCLCAICKCANKTKGNKRTRPGHSEDDQQNLRLYVVGQLEPQNTFR